MNLSKSAALAAALLLAATSFPAAATSMISTVDPSGKIPEAALATSAMFETVDAGLVRDGRSIGFYWVVKPRATLEAPLYVRVTYANPCGEPLVNDALIDPSLAKVGLSSPDFVLGLEKGELYAFRLEVFRQKGDAEPIEVMEQKIVSVYTSWGCDSQ